jgi:hypothetical protein
VARLWTCGFENQSATEWQTTNGTPTISTSIKRTGGASLRCNPTAGVSGLAHTIFSSGQAAGRFFLRAYVRVDSYPSARTAIMGWADNTTGTTGFMCIKMNTDGTLIAGGSGATTGTATAALTIGSWYRVEMDYDDSANTINAYLNGVLWATVAAADLGGGSIFRVGVMQTATADLYFDDAAINDTTGSAQTGLPGAGNVVHLRPDSAGDNTGFATTVGGSSNWQRVSEVTPDDATTYNATVATGTTTIDDFNCGTAAGAGLGASDTVKLVQVGGRIGSNAATAASLVYRIKSQAAGTVLESASVSVALNGWATHKAAAPFIHQLTSYVDPQAGGAWTIALLNAAQIGYRSNVSQTTARRVSALWALVETVPTTSQALTLAAGTDTAQPLARRKTQALGVATETSTARGLGRPIGQLKDSFATGIDGAKWPNSFGTYSEVAGRARVACTTGYNAVSSALGYTLRESSAYLRAYAPAGGGATTEAWAQVLVKSIVGGTDLGFELRMTTGDLVAFSRTGYVDGGEVTLTYSPTDHAWLRIRETGGNTLWDTSPDGSTWTNRRTLTSPAYVGDTDLEFQLIAHRSDGVGDFAEFDNVNTGGAVSQALTLASETDTGQSLARLKSQALPIASETGAAQPVGKAKTKALGTAVEADTGQPLLGGKRKALAPAASSEAAQPFARSKRQTIGIANSTTAAQALAGRKTETLALVTGTDAAQPLAGTKRVILGVAGETGAAQPVAGSKTQALGRAAETVAALPLAPASGLQTAEETSTARPLARSKRAALGIASESTAARSLGFLKSRALLPGVESATSLSLGGGKARALAPAEEAWTARPLAGAKARALTTAGEASSALVLTGSMAGVLGAAQVVDLARPLAAGKRLSLGVAVGVDTARVGPYYRLGVAVETVQVQALAGSRQRPADQLTAGTSGPALSASAAGPGLSPSSSGPQLAASVTSGGG